MPIVKASDPDKEKSLLSLFASAGGAAGSAGRVYMGRAPVSLAGGGRFMSEAAQAQVSRRTADRWLSEEEAKGDFYGWSDKKRSDFMGKMVLGGLLPVGSGILDAEKGWNDLVEAAGRFGKNGQKVSPWDLLDSYVKAAGGTGKNAWQQRGAFEVNTVTGEMRYAGPGVYLGNGKAMQTDTRIDLTDPDTAKALATKLFQDMMGRDPGAGELGAFASALSAAEAASPVTQSTTTTYDMETGQPVSQDTTSSGGVSAEGKAYIGEQQIKKKKEYGVNQAVTTYQGALENLVFGSPG